MQVSRIEIFGFKSFMERLILPLEGGITGIVGPNGCGKSNVVDALRWVLGETNARSLRGGRLEDIIFSGTDKLRPLGLAEVSITVRSISDSIYNDILDKSKEGALQAQLEEAEAEIQKVSKKLKELTHEKEQLEKEEAPLEVEDSQEVPSGGRPNLRVISRGESDPEADAHEAHEEEEAKKPTYISEAVLLQKFGWLRGVSEVQVTRRVYRSGESEFFLNRTPCRLRDLKEFFRVVGLSARTFTIVAQGEVSRIITAKADQRRQIFEEAAGVLGLREKISTAERRLKDTADNIARLEDIEKEVERQVTSLRRQANRARRREGLKAELLENESSVLRERFLRVVARREHITEELRVAKESETALVAQHEESSQGEERFRSTLLQTEVQVEELRANLDTLRDAVNERGRKEEAFRARINELHALREAKSNESSRIAERLELLEERKSVSEKRIADLIKNESELQEKIEDLEGRYDARLEELTIVLQKTRDEIREFEKTLETTRDSLRRVEGELEAISTQLRADSLYELLEGERGREFSAILERINGEVPKLLAELIQIEPRYVKAVQAALGEKASYFVVNQLPEVAKAFGDLQARENEEQEARRFWYGLVARKVTTNGTPRLSNGELTPADTLVEAEEEASDLVKHLLEGVYVASDLPTALNALKSVELGEGVTVVTEQGEIVTHSSCATPREESGVLDIQHRLQEISAQKNSLTNEFEAQSTFLASKKNYLLSQEAEQANLIKEKQEQEQKLRELTNEIGSVRGHLSAERRVVEQIEGDLSRTVEHKQELSERLTALNQQREQTDSSLNLLLQDDQQKIQEEAEQIKLQLTERDDERRTLREQFEDLRRASESQWRKLEEARQKVSTEELNLERARLEEEHIIESAREKLPEEQLEVALNPHQDLTLNRLNDEELSEREERVRSVKSQLIREGEVDPNSIEEYETQSTRLEELRDQKNDLAEASKTLERTVEMLREQSVTRFLATFEEVKEHFVTLMPRLFGGGSADLELGDPNNPLESGIDILIRPPGKKLKSLDLLSGGEKALCATALIMSLFLVRPSPLCVLDEVDAPLDDANLVRFLSLIKDMSSKTQFMVITHNKASMAAADRLVGVTMQRPGASSVITVSLEEAYEQVA